MTLHWTGTTWVQTANPGGTRDSFLYGVSMLSAADGWAVGHNNQTNTAIILHWNGAEWTQS